MLKEAENLSRMILPYAYGSQTIGFITTLSVVGTTILKHGRMLPSPTHLSSAPPILFDLPFT